MRSYSVKTHQRDEMLDVTDHVREAVRDAGVRDGQALAYVPHTTAGITINENADPDVVHDMLAQLDKMVPWSQPFYRHGEGNSASHVKASMMGSSVTVLVRDGELVLGTWQGIWFCEFDGPRTRKLHVAVHNTN
ncbi:secondary thiamine-phosphate synthase enzyme YjbQ [Phycisphaerales bacterium AB-hyl4]|uniref:Secondary thiamine-phosphate synthase enzyme YjbQ n=1 Tax=Natronomicrosphaera hydrolytica TaxID=3242702 RepID=A0ABV4U8P0_9BACT